MSREELRILVVDDNLELAENLAEILEIEGIDSEVAADGPSALQRMSERDFELVITDIRMPGMNGVELLRKIHEYWPATRVVAMSAYASDSTLDDAATAGALDVLSKPVDCDEIVKLARRIGESKATLLLVEDDRGLRVNLTEILLQETDVVPYPVADLATARKLIEQVEFGAAIVDVKLPDGDGLLFGRQLVERFGDELKVLHITAYLKEVETLNEPFYSPGGGVNILEKPFAPSRLLTLLEKMAF